MNKVKTKVPLAMKLGIGAVEIGGTASFYMISSYLTIFYQDVMGLAPLVISILMLSVRIIEAISAPVFGSVIDRTQSKWGKCRPWILRCTPFVVVFSILTFFSPNLSHSGKAVYAFVTYIGLALAFSLLDSSKHTIPNLMTYDSQQRMTLNSAKSVSGQVASLILAGATMPLILFFGGNSSGYFYTNLIYSLVSLPILIFAFFSCKEKVVINNSDSSNKFSFKDTFKTVAENKQLLFLLLYSVITMTAVFCRMGIMTYYYMYAYGKPEVMGFILMGFSIAQIITAFIVPFITKRVGKKNTLIIANCGQAGSLILLHLVGFENDVLVFLFTFLLGLFMMQAVTMFGASSDCIEYAYFKTGKRVAGTTVGAVNLSVKLGLAIGGAIGIFFVTAAGYYTGVELTSQIRTNISLAVNVIPSVIFLLGLLALIPYKLNNARVAEIQAANQEKDAQIQ